MDEPAAKASQWRIFIGSVFFVLGFSVIFSLLGVLLQTLLAGASFTVKTWLGRTGGAFIILFGLYLMGLLDFSFLNKERKFRATKTTSFYLTSFLFGATFAIGWTPCVGAVLGAVLGLAVTQPGMAFTLLMAYTIGLGLPFLLVGLFTSRAENLIRKYTDKLKYLDYVFGALLIILGIFVFTDKLGKLAGWTFVTNLLIRLDLAGISLDANSLTLGVSFLAGVVSFLSPCVLPLIPAFLTYLATSVVKK